MIETSNKIRLSHNVIKPETSFIVELVGPAGAGKTTLSRVLCQRDERILIGAEIELRKLEHIPRFVSHFAYLLPLLGIRCRKCRWFTWNEIKKMVYLQAWSGVLRQQASNGSTVILLDHGPVFKLATLNAFGPEGLKGQGFERWWHRIYQQWAFTLDMVIWLDAPETVLVERINSREQGHIIKGKPGSEAYQFLECYRMSYGQILDKLKAYGNPPLLQFDTSQATIEEIADEVLVTCGLNPCGNIF